MDKVVKTGSHKCKTMSLSSTEVEGGSSVGLPLREVSKVAKLEDPFQSLLRKEKQSGLPNETLNLCL